MKFSVRLQSASLSTGIILQGVQSRQVVRKENLIIHSPSARASVIRMMSATLPIITLTHTPLLR